jgi:hypothetical protein
MEKKVCGVFHHGIVVKYGLIESMRRDSLVAVLICGLLLFLKAAFYK